MKILSFERNNEIRMGVVDNDQVVDIQTANSKIPADLRTVLEQNNGSLQSLSEAVASAPSSARLSLAEINYALPIGNPGKIVCLGLNYLEHAKEGGHQKPTVPSVFMRCTTSLVPHKKPILRPLVSETLDYECELLVVIGKKAKHLTLANAYSCIAGYSCFNDGSIRQFQRRTAQWDMGKNFDQTGGFGPWIVTADELPEGAKGLKIETRLNGTVMQTDNTENMIFPVAETLVDLTQGITLMPGDLVAMGTPSGVGHARRPQVWMKDGDTCEIEIEGIGTLINPIRTEGKEDF